MTTEALRDITKWRQEIEVAWRGAILEALELGMSQSEVGKYAGVTQQRVAQIVREERERTDGEHNHSENEWYPDTCRECATN